MPPLSRASVRGAVSQSVQELSKAGPVPFGVDSTGLHAIVTPPEIVSQGLNLLACLVCAAERLELDGIMTLEAFKDRMSKELALPREVVEGWFQGYPPAPLGQLRVYALIESMFLEASETL